jgi:hypothetical protein
VSEDRTFFQALGANDQMVVWLRGSEDMSFRIQYESVLPSGSDFVPICKYESTDTGYVRLTRFYNNGAPQEQRLTSEGQLRAMDCAFQDLGANWQRYRDEY